MSDHRDDKQNTGTPGPEDFSLEEILAEFGGGAVRPTRWKEDTIPFPVGGRRPQAARPAPAGGKPAGAGKVVDFPGGRPETPPPAPPEPEPEPPAPAD